MDSLFICGIILFLVTTQYTVHVVHGQPQYEVQLRYPVSFEYGAGRENELADGSCCSSSESSPNCNTPCNTTVIHMCFYEEGGEDNGDCPLGAASVAPNTTSTSDIPLSVGTQSQATTTTTYPGRYRFSFDIVTTDAQSERVIDGGRLALMHSIEDRENGNYNGVAIGAAITVLRLEVRVVCREGYSGPDCTCGCSPRDDSTGHFTCGADCTKVCLPGYQDPETNCAMEIPTPKVSTITKFSSVTIETNTVNVTMTTQAKSSEPTSTLMQQSIKSETASTTVSVHSTVKTTSAIIDSNNNSVTTVTTSVDTPAPLSSIPIAVGGAVGGLTLIVIMISAIFVAICASRYKRKSNAHVAVMPVTLLRLKEDPSNSDGMMDDTVLYTPVRKNTKTKREEAPPIVPYQGDIYEEVEKTGLFAKTVEDTPEKEPLHSTAAVNAQLHPRPWIEHAQVSTVANTQEGEAPPIIPDQENIYTEVDATELLASTEDTPQVENPRYSTILDEAFESDEATAPYSNVGSGRGDREYSEIDTKTQREEAPPITPYQGDIYEEVEKTGLFAKTAADDTEKEPLYSTADLSPPTTQRREVGGYVNVSTDESGTREYFEIGTIKSGLQTAVNSENNLNRSSVGGDIDVPNMYTPVNRDAKTQKGEAPPPITPYQGDIYTEVEKTGLFAETAAGDMAGTENEPLYGTDDHSPPTTQVQSSVRVGTVSPVSEYPAPEYSEIN